MLSFLRDELWHGNIRWILGVEADEHRRVMLDRACVVMVDVVTSTTFFTSKELDGCGIDLDYWKGTDDGSHQGARC